MSVEPTAAIGERAGSIATDLLDHSPNTRNTIDIAALRAPATMIGTDPRFVGVLLPVRSDIPWGHKNNHPIFAAASARGLPVALHAWGRPGQAPTANGFASTYLEQYLGSQVVAQSQLINLVCEGAFERFPELR
ncbi:MAG: hypothetical protein ACXVR2_06015 [Solirubrobacteraceae bacterium]